MTGVMGGDNEIMDITPNSDKELSSSLKTCIHIADRTLPINGLRMHEATQAFTQDSLMFRSNHHKLSKFLICIKILE